MHAVQAGSGSASPRGGAGPLAASLTSPPARVAAPAPDVPTPSGPQKVISLPLLATTFCVYTLSRLHTFVHECVHASADLITLAALPAIPIWCTDAGLQRMEALSDAFGKHHQPAAECK